MQITLGPQYNVGEKPTVILYIYINRHAGTPEKQFYLVLGKRHDRVYPGQNATQQGTYLFTA